MAFFSLTIYLQSSGRQDDTESRYSSQYEERLDPFNTFNRKERQRKYMNLSPFDKATLSMVSRDLRSKRMCIDYIAHPCMEKMWNLGISLPGNLAFGGKFLQF